MNAEDEAGGIKMDFHGGKLDGDALVLLSVEQMLVAVAVRLAIDRQRRRVDAEDVVVRGQEVARGCVDVSGHAAVVMAAEQGVGQAG
ncbi:MAG TPA: hypothetical protein VN915_11280, partial [Elusimicrobiota bacterium]|nr:hypothetical protein [Elusimicrobiota bacterium]